MRVELTLVSTPSADTAGTTIFIDTGRAAYTFGHVPEGYQRAIKYRAVPWTKTVQAYFLSGSSEWEGIGGLPGMLLTLAAAGSSIRTAALDVASRKGKDYKVKDDVGNFDVPIHGADNLSHMFAALRPLVLRQPIKITLHEHREESASIQSHGRAPDYQDEFLNVWKIPTQKIRSGSPWKRCHTSPPPDSQGSGQASDENRGVKSGEEILKSRPGPSDPLTAKWIVENGMLDGTMDCGMLMAPRQARELKPSEEAYKVINGQLTPFQPQDGESSQSSEIVYVRTSTPEAGALDLKARPLPRTSYGEQCMSYIFKSRDHRGKFDPVAASAKGVERQDFKRLANGETLVSKTGETVTPDMVLGKTVPGKGVGVAEIPSADMVDSFFDRPEWTDPELMEHVVAIYWLLGKGMYNHARILEYMRSKPDIRHIICAPETSPNGLTNPRSAEFTTQLHRLDPERFPVLKFNETPDVELPKDHPGETCRLGERFTLMPTVKPDKVPGERLADFPEAIQRVPAAAIAKAQEAKKTEEDPAFLARIEEDEKDIPNRDAEIICLGTSSSNPSDIRGLCGTIVRVPGIGNYLLDCGEGVLGQLRRSFGNDEIGSVLANLKCIVVSHIHGDHVLGIISVIKAWYQQMLADGNHGSKLAISCDARVKLVVEEISQAEDIGFHRLSFPNCVSNGSVDHNVKEARGSQVENGAFGLTSIKRINVLHCHQSCGTQLELTSGLRIAWSGDCRPSMAFADACRGAHLLVHEATFDDNEKQHAKDKKHSTLSEALDVARRMEARRTVLTHFSTRYTGAANLSNGDGSVLLGWDFMRVKLGDFKKAALYMPAIEILREVDDK
jgi:ribonuclease Z